MVLSTLTRIVFGVIVWFMLLYLSHKVTESISVGGNLAAHVFWLAIATLLAIALCCEMLINNPHNGIFIQVELCALAYMVACSLGVCIVGDKGQKIVVLLFFLISFGILHSVLAPRFSTNPAPSDVPSEYIEMDGKKVHVDHEVTKSVKLASLGDSYEVSGVGFCGAFVINTGLYYRFLYFDENGYKCPDSLSVKDNVRICDGICDDCANGQAPRLEYVCSYDVTYRLYNKRLIMKKDEYTIKEWKVLHVPKGSIVADFRLDLQ